MTTFSVGDTVYFEDAYDKTKRHAANFRGFDGDNAVVVWNGSQMAIERSRVFKEAVAESCPCCGNVLHLVQEYEGFDWPHCSVCGAV